MSTGTLPSFRANKVASERKPPGISEKAHVATEKAIAFAKDFPSRVTQTYRDMPQDEHTWTIGSVSHNRKAGVEDMRRRNEEEEAAKKRKFHLVELRPKKAASMPPPGGAPAGPAQVPGATSRWSKISNRVFYGTTDGASDEDPSRHATPEAIEPATFPPGERRLVPQKSSSLPIIRVEEIRDEDIMMPFGPASVPVPKQPRSESVPLPVPAGSDGPSDPVDSSSNRVRFGGGTPTTSAQATTPGPSATTSASVTTPAVPPLGSHMTLPAEPLDEKPVKSNRRRMRRVRSAMLREPVLQVMLGRQLAGVVKPALIHLGEGGTLGIHEVPSTNEQSP